MIPALSYLVWIAAVRIVHGLPHSIENTTNGLSLAQYTRNHATRSSVSLDHNVNIVTDKNLLPEGHNIMDSTKSKMLWEKAIKKGEEMKLAMLQADESGSMQSKWPGNLHSELTKWGWDTNDDQAACEFEEQWGIGDELSSLGLSSDPKEYGGDNECFRVEHGKGLKEGESAPMEEQPYYVGEGEDQKKYLKTGAHFQGAVNQEGGVIFAQFLESPAHAAMLNWNREPQEDELPKVHYLSDILWDNWNKDNPKVANIRYFWVQGVSNLYTLDLMKTALQNMKKPPETLYWPGATFHLGLKADSHDSDQNEAALALIASPNGQSFVNFLTSHKKELGRKVIVQVRIYRPKDDEGSITKPDMVFHVADVVD
jgi:hypothetical protein